MTKFIWQDTTNKTDEILPKINNLIFPIKFEKGDITLKKVNLSFYKNHDLISITNKKTKPNITKYALYDKDKECFIINFTNDPIYKVNKLNNLKLNKDNVRDYAHFFFNFVRGRHGSYRIIEKKEDLPLTEKLDVNIGKIISENISPIEIMPDKNVTIYRLSTCFAFNNAFFKATLRITESGLVKITDEHVLIRKLPIKTRRETNIDGDI